jgi:dienelactone hydrolase
VIDPPSLSELQSAELTFHGRTRTVRYLGAEGPGVVLMHEIPGMTPNVLRLAKLLTLRGFRVALPSLFGTDGRAPSGLLDSEMLLKMCINAEFNVFAANGSSSIVDWLREFCQEWARQTGGNVAAIGLCITGGFALSLTVDVNGTVQAAVMSEPSLPFPLPFTGNASGLHLSPGEVEAIRARPTPCLALRFTSDYRCKRERFDAYQNLLSDKLIRIEVQSPDATHHIGADAHSVLTEELSDSPGNPTWMAFDRLVDFLRLNLQGRPP